MELYAGINDGTYEYAVWARNNAELVRFLGSANATKQKGNKALEALVPDKSMAYRRLLTDDAPWEVWKRVRSNYYV